MTTDIIFGSCYKGVNKAGKDFRVVHYLYQDQFGNMVANADFRVSDKAFVKAEKLQPLKSYKADVLYVSKGVNVLVDILE